MKHLRDTLRAMYRYALANKKLDPRIGSPVDGVDKELVKVPKTETKSLSPEQALGLLEYSHPRWTNFFALLIYTGLRKQEGLLLEAKDVHLKQRYILVKKTKTKMYRKVPIPAELVPYLQTQMLTMMPGETLLFGKTRSDIKLEKVMRTALKYAGVKEHFCLKDLRSTHGTLAAEATGDLRYVQGVLGHTDMNITNERYAKFRLKWSLRKADKFSLLNHQYEEDEVTAS